MNRIVINLNLELEIEIFNKYILKKLPCKNFRLEYHFKCH